MSALNECVVGSRDFRNNLSEFLDQAINKKRVFLVGRLHRPTETATLMPTQMLESLVSETRFDSSITYDEETEQYVASVKGFNADGVGATPEEAVEMALDNMESLLDDFLSNTDRYLSFARLREHLPHYLRLMTTGRHQMAAVLGFRLGD